jgi:hypothetical protein
MTHPQDVREGEDLQIWRVAASVLNEQLQATNKRWSSSFWVHSGTNTSPYPENEGDTFLQNTGNHL